MDTVLCNFCSRSVLNCGGRVIYGEDGNGSCAVFAALPMYTESWTLDTSSEQPVEKPIGIVPKEVWLFERIMGVKKVLAQEISEELRKELESELKWLLRQRQPSNTGEDRSPYDIIQMVLSDMESDEGSLLKGEWKTIDKLLVIGVDTRNNAFNISAVSSNTLLQDVLAMAELIKHSTAQGARS